MTVRSKTGTATIDHQPAAPKRTRQGKSLRTKLSATSRNGKRRRYRGQGG